MLTINEPIKQKFNISHEVTIKDNLEAKETLEMLIPSFLQTGYAANFKLMVIRFAKETFVPDNCMRVVQMKHACSTASEYTQLQVIMWLCA